MEITPSVELSLEQFLDMQAALQLRMPPPNRDPSILVGDERATFLVWNCYALMDELHEAMDETGWKPWATSRHLDADKFLKEMVDAWHFFMNILLVVGGEKGWTREQLASEFTRLYVEKNQVNATRQEQGYDGLSTKCPNCKREMTETNTLFHFDLMGKSFCTETCAEQFAGAVS